MFGSTSGGKAGMSGTPDQTGKGALKWARSKEGADQGAMSSDPQNDATLKESSPHWNSPGLQNTRDCFTLLFGVQVMPLLGNGTESPVLPPYAWNEWIITDTLSPSIDGITQVIILNPVECFVFKGHQSRGEGFTLEEATGIAAQLHRSYDHWIGRRIHMCCIPHILRDVCMELKVARESVREINIERLGMAHSPNRKQPASLWDSECSRGYVRQSDQYFASQYLSQKKRGRDRREEEDHACRGYHETWTDTADTWWFDARDSPTNLYARAESTECCRGHPLGWVGQRKCQKHFGMLSTAPKRNSQIQCQSMCLRIAVRSLMTLWHMTRRHLTIRQSSIGIDERRGTDTMPTTSTERNDATIPVIDKRSWISPFSEIPHLTTP